MSPSQNSRAALHFALRGLFRATCCIETAEMRTTWSNHALSEPGHRVQVAIHASRAGSASLGLGGTNTLIQWLPLIIVLPTLSFLGAYGIQKRKRWAWYAGWVVAFFAAGAVAYYTM